MIRNCIVKMITFKKIWNVGGTLGEVVKNNYATNESNVSHYDHKLVKL